VLDGEDFDGVTEVVEADAIVSDAKAQFGWLHILGDSGDSGQTK
jgi:hypothetical protein